MVEHIDNLYDSLATLTPEKLNRYVESILREEGDNPKTREYILTILGDIQRGNFHTLIAPSTLERDIVSLDRFIEDDYYLGLKGSIWPELRVTARNIVHGGYVEALLTGAIGIGKALDVTTPILTVNRGWQTMGSLVDGDIIYDERGEPTNVIKAHDVLVNRECYRVEFSDGTHVIADADHLWHTRTRVDRNKRNPKLGSVKTTKQIRDSLIVGSRYRNHSIANTLPLRGCNTDLPLHPYLLGYWLGNGHSKAARFTVGEHDEQSIVGFMRSDGWRVESRNPGEGKAPLYQVFEDHKGIRLIEHLNKLGLKNNKHIPEIYLRASIHDRTLLLQGLMDSDGYASKTGSLQFTNKSKVLFDNVVELVRTLGAKPVSSTKFINGTEYYTVTFHLYRDSVQAFRLDRKLERQPYEGAQSIRQKSRYIVAIDPVETRPVRCITVDSPNSLYLAGEQLIPTHNTTLAQIINAYYLYLVSVEKYPQRRFSLMPSSSIVFAMLNRTDSLAKDVTFKEFYSMIDNSPYFKEEFPFDKDVKSKLVFPKNVEVIYSGAYSKSLLGKNIIGGIIDEMNFMSVVKKSKQSKDGDQFDQAQEVYRSLTRRRKSRFMLNGKLPGCLCLVSSTGHPNDFTEKRIQELEKEAEDDNPALTYIWKKSQWEVVPSERFSGKKFLLEVGDERRDPRIISSYNEAKEGIDVIEVPTEYKNDFVRDMNGSMRDFAGRTTLATKSFMGSKDGIWNIATLFENEGFVPIFKKNEIYSDEELPEVNPEWVLKNPDAKRVAHIDLAVIGDSCGIAIGHSDKLIDIRKVDRATGRTHVETLPRVVYDLLFTIIPIHGVEIDFAQVRALLYFLRDELGIPIKIVTFDGFQSVDSKQMLLKKRFMTDYLSVDGKNSYKFYNSLKQGIHNEQVLAPEHPRCFNELEQLEFVKAKKIVDHPPQGSKDTADGMCGVYTNLLKLRSTWNNYSASATSDPVEYKATSIITTNPNARRPSRRPTGQRRQRRK